MSGKLLDTNVAINFIKGIVSAQNILSQYEKECRVSSITVGELMFGAKKSNLSDFNKTTYINFCNLVGIVDVDSEIAQIYGDIKNQLISKGKPIPENDIWLAATAISKDMVLISYDKHFENIEGLNFIFVKL